MSSAGINIHSTLSDLDWYEKSFGSEELIKQLLEYFKSPNSLPGVIILEKGRFYRLVSKTKFHKKMSQQFMFELFNNRKIESLFDESDEETALILPYSSSILDAANLAIKRKSELRYDPVIIEFENHTYGIIGFYQLLMAQMELHQLTLNSLKEANEFKKDILGILAHDLRNPLNAIQGFSEILGMDGCSGEDIIEYSGYINKAAHQMNTLLAEMLHSASEDATEIEINKSSFDLLSLVKTVIRNQAAQAAGKKQHINFKITGMKFKCEILADKTKIQEVLDNIISNAIKYSDNGGCINININYGENVLTFSVEDSGPGFTPEDLTRLFGKFQRLSARPTAGESSTGLGLYITKKIVEQHGGNIYVKQPDKKGSIFIVELPINI